MVSIMRHHNLLSVADRVTHNKVWSTAGARASPFDLRPLLSPVTTFSSTIPAQAFGGRVDNFFVI